MKVLIITDYYYPHWTGISKSILHLVTALKHKISFTIITTQHERGLSRYESKTNHNIYREPYLFSFSRLRYSPQIILRTIHLIKNHDVVLINSPCSNILPVSIIAKLFQKKLLIFHQGDLRLTRSPLNLLIEYLFNLSTHLSCYLSDQVATYTKDYAQFSGILKKHLSKFTPLLLPINPKSIINPSTKIRSHIRQTIKLARNKHQYIFGFSGRFVEEKGIDIFLKAIGKITPNHPNIHFLFAGDPNIKYENFYQKNYRRFTQLHQHISILGLLNDKELNYFYQSIDFLILPSRSECFGLVQVEAMLTKTPVIVSDIPGARDIVKQSQFGIIFESENASALSQAIITAIAKRRSILENHPKAMKYLSYQHNQHLTQAFFTDSYPSNQ